VIKIKGVIIAAGMGSRLLPVTKELPKCLLEINGKTMLQHQLDAFKENNITDVAIVKGFQHEKIDVGNVSYFLNEDYENNNILASLFYAKDFMDSGFISSYSDIVYDKEIVKKLKESEGDFCVVVDENWKKCYEGRTLHPIEEAENVVLDKNNVIKIGKHINSEEAHAEFIGLAKFSDNGVKIIKELYEELENSFLNLPFQQAKIFQKSYLTDFFQELINRDFKVTPVKIESKWCEIDTYQDLQKSEELFGGN